MCDHRILSLVKKTPFATSNQAKKTLREVDVSFFTVKISLGEWKFRGFGARYKPLVILENKKTTLDWKKCERACKLWRKNKTKKNKISHF